MKLDYSVSVSENISLIILSNAPSELCFIADTFKTLGDKGINIDMISQVPPQGIRSHLGFTINDDDLGATLDVISSQRETFPEIKSAVCSGNCKITVSSDQMRTMPGVAAEVLSALSKSHVDVRLITTSETEIAFLVSEPYSTVAAEAVKRCFE